MDIAALQIEISASSESALKKVGNLIKRLDALKTALNNIPSDKVNDLKQLGEAANFTVGDGPSKLASALKKIVSQKDSLGSVVDDVSRLASLDFSNLEKGAAALQQMTRSTRTTTRSAASSEMTVNESGVTAEVGATADAYNKEADAAENASSAVTEHAKASSAAARHVEAHHSALLKVIKTFARIAAYRVVRTMIKEVGQAFADGRNNITQYSEAMNRLDASHVAQNMHDIAVEALYAKNSLGAMMAPIIESAVPAIQTLVSWLHTGTDAIAQFLAALQGKTTYTRAKKYEDLADDIKDVGSAAKEALRYLLPFDELNVLPDNSNRGSTTDTGMDYSEMFEEADIAAWALKFNEKVQPIIQWVKDNLGDILKTAGLIGTALLGWKIASSFLLQIPEIKGLVDTVKDKLGIGKALEIGFGIILTLTGFTMSYGGAHNIAVNGWDKATLMDKVSAILGPWVAGLGGALIGGALAGIKGAAFGFSFGFGIALVLEGIALAEVGAYNVGLVGWDSAAILDKVTTVLGPVLAAIGGAIAGSAFGVPGAVIGATIGLAIGLTVVGIKLAEGEKQGVRDRFYSSDIGKEFAEIKKSIEDHAIEIDNMNVRVKNVKANFDSGAWKGNFEEAKKIVEEIFAMDESDNKTYTQILRIKDGIDRLNEMGFTDLNLRFDDLTGHIEGSKDEVMDTIEQLRIMAQTEALYDMLVERSRDYYTATNDVKKATEELTKAQESKEKVENRMKEIEKELNDLYADTDSWTRDTAKHVDELGKEYTDLDKILNNEVAQALKDAQGNLDTANETLGIATGNLEDVQKALKDVQTPADQAARSVETAATRMETAVSRAVNKMNTDLKSIINPDIVATVRLDVENDKNNNKGRKINGITLYADGGYISNGELYIAREAGPEMVGRIGNRNAVANNDQIVSGIAAGVEEANEPVVNAVLAIGAQIVGAIRESGGSISLDDIARGVTRYQNRMARAVGV